MNDLRANINRKQPSLTQDFLSLFRTGSVSSEDDGEDWPTSPIVAVCEQFDE